MENEHESTWNEQETTDAMWQAEQGDMPSAAQLRQAATIVYSYMSAAACAHAGNLSGVRPVPPHSLAETNARVERRYLLPIKRKPNH